MKDPVILLLTHTLNRLFGDYTLGRKEKNKHGPKWLRAKGLMFHIFVVSLVICLAKSRNHQKSLPFFLQISHDRIWMAFLVDIRFVTKVGAPGLGLAVPTFVGAT